MEKLKKKKLTFHVHSRTQFYHCILSQLRFVIIYVIMNNQMSFIDTKNQL